MSRFLPTRDAILRQGIDAEPVCPFCEVEVESADHVAVSYVLLRGLSGLSLPCRCDWIGSRIYTSLCCIFWVLLIVTLLLGAEWDLYALGGSESYGFLWKEFVK